MIAVRQATLDDAGEIHELLLGLAADLPLQVDSLEREEALYALIRNGTRSGESWVACDERGGIVGCLVAELSQLGRHYAEHEVVELHHLGATAKYRAEAAPMLLDRVLARLLPVTVRVSPLNRTGFAAQLAAAGFRQTAVVGGETSWRWEPGERQ